MKLELVVNIISILFGCGGFWAFVGALITSKKNKDSASDEMLKGIGHHLIIDECERIIAKGSLSLDEYENLVEYLYVPYEKLGGNGSAKRMVDIVKTLPIK